MMAEGWISLHRCLQTHWLWEDKPFSYGQAWIDLLMMVNHKDKKVLMDASLVTVPAGSVITSEVKLSERWGWSRHKTRTFLKLLETDSMIEKKSDNKKTAINVVNWAKYQIPSTADEQQKDINGTSTGHQRDTNNNELIMLNNDNNGEEKNTPAPPIEPLQTVYQTDLDEIIATWNAQSCTRRIDKIPFGGRRYSNTMLAINNDLPSFLRTIKDLDNQEWFVARSRRKDPLSYDWFVDPNNYIKVIEGNYRELRQAEHQETEQERTLRMLREATE